MNMDIKAMTDRDLLKTILAGMTTWELAPEIEFLWRGLPEGEIFTVDELKLAGASEKEAEELFWMFALASRAGDERSANNEI
jgi:hypothetical protein